jgi:hypothetical protein
MTTNRSTAFRAGIVQGLVIAALMLAATAGLKYLSPGHISPDLTRRLLGVLLGVPAVIYANIAPKALSPLARMRCDPAAEQSMRRFSAWTLLVGGVAYMLTWAIAPLDLASTLATSILGGAVLLVIARLAWSMWRRPTHHIG